VVRRSEGLHAQIDLAAAMPGTRVELSMDGTTLLDTVVPTVLTTYELEIPASLVITGNNFVRVKQTFPATPAYEIGNTGVTLAHDVTARSAGWAVGMTASIAIDGVDKPAAARGLTMFRLDDGTQHNYDTFAKPGAASRFAEAVAALPDGTPVALVVADDASTLWTEDADAALRALGGERSLRGAYRASYALIGVKGAKPGSALESLSDTRAVHATLGRPYAQAVRGTLWHDLWLRPSAP
jgi:hypothetical protein